MKDIGVRSAEEGGRGSSVRATFGFGVKVVFLKGYFPSDSPNKTMTVTRKGVRTGFVGG